MLELENLSQNEDLKKISVQKHTKIVKKFYFVLFEVFDFVTNLFTTDEAGEE